LTIVIYSPPDTIEVSDLRYNTGKIGLLQVYAEE